MKRYKTCWTRVARYLRELRASYKITTLAHERVPELLARGPLRVVAQRKSKIRRPEKPEAVLSNGHLRVLVFNRGKDYCSLRLETETEALIVHVRRCKIDSIFGMKGMPWQCIWPDRINTRNLIGVCEQASELLAPTEQPGLSRKAA